VKLLVATQNKGKQREFTQLLADLDVELAFPEDINLAKFDVTEDGQTIQDNALLKAQAFAKKSGLPAMADDYGIEVKSLNGDPGVKSKRFHPGTDTDRNLHLLDLLKTKDDRSAQTVCSVCVAMPDGTFHCEQGIIPGQIAFEIKGDQGFGYDVVFIPKGETKTIAELGQAYKNTHSHRALAVQKIKPWLREQF
jgi:XTP/dITP diphosphohydrolase